MSTVLGAIDQIALTVDDVDAAEAFYEQTLGLTKIFRPQPTMVFFQCGNLSILLEKSQDGSMEPGGAVLYFNVDDMTASVAELKARGLFFIDRPHLVTRQPGYDLYMTFFRDPAGNLLALSYRGAVGGPAPAG